MNTYQRLLLLAIPLLMVQQAQATHFVGVVNYYECLTPTMYRLYHHAYYHCSSTPIGGGIGTIPQPSGISLSTQGNPCNPPIFTNIWTLTSAVDIAPVCPGVPTTCNSASPLIQGTLEMRHYTDIDFSPAGTCTQISVDWNGCCRNQTITSGLALGGIFQRVDIDLGISPCNNSPVVLMTPRPYICEGVPTSISLNAFDIDGDELRYSLVACQTAAGVFPSYSTGYSIQNPLGSGWQVQLDSLSGELFVNPIQGGPVAGHICVEIAEYRNGYRIGAIGYELLLSVDTSCSGSTFNFPPSIDQLQVIKGGILSDNWEITMCQGDTLIFQVAASDTNPTQTLRAEIPSRFSDFTVNYTPGNPVLAEYTLITDRQEDFYLPIVIWDNQCPMNTSSVQHVFVKVGNNCLQAQTTAANCGSPLGTIDLSVWGGAAPFQYIWNTGDTTEDLNNVVPGIYSVQVTDANNRVFVDSFVVNALNISINPSLTLPNCADQGGMIHTAISGATPPYTYLWNTGATSDSLANLSSGGYSLTIRDSQGCPRHEAFLLKRPDSCFNIIEGQYYEDRNGNCLFDGNDVPKAYQLIQVNPGIDVFTDVNGFYRLELDSGAHSWRPAPNPFQRAICPAGRQYQMAFPQTGASLSQMDFGVQTDSVLDQRLSYYSSRARPGFLVNHRLTVHNDGNRGAASSLSWTHDSIFTLSSVAPAPASYDSITRTITWTFTQARPGGTEFQAFIQTRVDTQAIAGTPYTNHAIVYPIVGDTTPGNNAIIYQDFTTGSFDPNDKHVYPFGEGPLRFTPLETERLTYRVRFQNTGNDTAFFVVIRDTIDPNLRIISYQREDESHPYQLRIEEDSILVFDFLNILLPDSNTNLAASQGFVQFSFLVKDNIASGTQIRNRAAIFFDFNDPIITNEVLNTLVAFPQLSLGQDSSLCAGESLTAELTQFSTPPYVFTWSNGVVMGGNYSGKSTITPNQPGSYLVQVTDSLGITHRQRINISFLPEPDAFFSFQPNGLFTTFTSPAPGNINWFWDFGDGRRVSGQQNPTHLYGQSGVYQVNLVTATECGFDTLSQPVPVVALNMEESDFESNIRIIPHPVQDVSFLHFHNPEQKMHRLLIYDIKGRLVHQLPPQRSSSFQIEKGSLKSGLHICEIRGKNSYFYKMVIK